jgi:hypothetical protein
MSSQKMALHAETSSGIMNLPPPFLSFLPFLLSSELDRQTQQAGGGNDDRLWDFPFHENQKGPRRDTHGP